MNCQLERPVSGRIKGADPGCDRQKKTPCCPPQAELPPLMGAVAAPGQRHASATCFSNNPIKAPASVRWLNVLESALHALSWASRVAAPAQRLLAELGLPPNPVAHGGDPLVSPTCLARQPETRPVHRAGEARMTPQGQTLPAGRPPATGGVCAGAADQAPPGPMSNAARLSRVGTSLPAARRQRQHRSVIAALGLPASASNSRQGECHHAW